MGRLEHNKELDFQRHIQAQISNFEYKRDYEEEKAWIYFPYHITEGYQLATDVSKNISDKEYKKGYNNDKSKGNVFKYSETPSYEFYKALGDTFSDCQYKKKYQTE